MNDESDAVHARHILANVAAASVATLEADARGEAISERDLSGGAAWVERVEGVVGERARIFRDLKARENRRAA